MEYIKELWVGYARGNYWNWELKGLDDDDFEGRAKACDDFIEEIASIKEFYEHLVEERVKPNS